MKRVIWIANIVIFLFLMVSCENSQDTRGKSGLQNNGSSTESMYQLEDYICNIIALDTNAFNNDMTINRMEQMITDSLKSFIPKHPNVLSDFPLEAKNVDYTGARFNGSMPLKKYKNYRVDIEVMARASQDVLSLIKQGRKYYITECDFVEFTFPWSMEVHKDALRIDEITSKRKILLLYRFSNPKFVEAN